MNKQRSGPVSAWALVISFTVTGLAVAALSRRPVPVPPADAAPTRPVDSSWHNKSTHQYPKVFPEGAPPVCTFPGTICYTRI